MNTQTAPVSSQSKEFDNVKRLPILISMIIGAFFTILNETLLNVAFPQLMVELNVTASTLQWLSTGYMLVVAVLIPASALLVQWFTTRQVFIGAMVIFTFGTLVSAIAPGFSILLMGRLLQAAGTGLIMPVLMNTILLLYPPEKRGAAMGEYWACNHVCPCHWADTFRAHFGNIELEMAILFRSSIRDFFLLFLHLFI